MNKWDYVQGLINKQKNKPGLQGKINAKCIDCIVDTAEQGGWADQVEACKHTDCSLWPVRPLSSKTKQKLKQERIDNMTPEQRAEYAKRCNKARERLQKGRNK